MSETTDLISSHSSTELARVTVNTEVDRETKNIGLNKLRFGLGSETKIDKFQNLLKIFRFRLSSETKIDKFRNLLKIFSLIIILYSSTLGADAFRTIIEDRLEKLRSKPSNPEQTWLILQPSRMSDSRNYIYISGENEHPMIFCLI